MHHRLDLLAHVIILIANLDLCRTGAVLRVDLIHQVLQLALAVFELRAVMVADDITQRRLFNRAAHSDQMVESLIALRVFRRLEARQHHGYLVSDTHRVTHLMVRRTRVHIQTVHMDLGTRCIEVLKLQLTDCTAIHRIGEIGTELLNVKMVCSAADLFVRRETDTHFTMLDLRVLDEVFHRRHDLGNTGFVICAQKGSGVRHNDVLSCITWINIIALFGLHDARLHMLSACVRTRIHMSNKTDHGDPFTR